MKRKIVSCVLLVCFLTYIGCYDTEMVTRDQLATKQGEADLIVITKDHRRFSFEAGKYSLFADSLTGDGMLRATQASSESRFTGSIPLSDIAFIEAQEFSEVKTIILAGGLTLGVVGLVAAAGGSGSSSSGGTGKFSCPFIYAFDSTQYHFESETFAGAVFRGVERTTSDVLKHLTPVNGECRLKLVNARQETEYVDELQLAAVDHPVGTDLIPDRTGTMHTISNHIRPASCVEFGGTDALQQILERDELYWQSSLEGRDWSDEHSARDGIVAVFPKPSDVDRVKLVVAGKNTLLGYFVLAKIFQLKGVNRLDWYTQLESDQVECAKFARWLMREGMLHVQIWEKDAWVEQSALPDVGPGISKAQVAVLDIRGIPGDQLKIRLESATDLWRIDQVYADYSQDCTIHTTQLPLRRAVNEQGEDVSIALREPDGDYYVTVNDQYATLSFDDVPQPKDSQRSYVARTKGFYYQWLESEGPARNDIVERILEEPGFGSKMFMPLWVKERKGYE